MRSSVLNLPYSCALSAVLFISLACGNNPPAGPAPTVSATTPLDAAANVDLATNPTATFDRAMAALDSTHFTLKQGATPVAGSVTTSPDGLTATFTPASPLAAGSAFTATVSAGAKSTAGGSLATDQSWSFNTTSPTGTVAPTLVSTSPSDTSTGVAINVKLSATFDMPMTALAAGNFSLKQGATPVAGTVANSADGLSATFTPASNFAAGTAYTATIHAPTSAAGIALAADHSWAFTTGAAADTTAPVVSATNPANTATGIATNVKVAATFSKAMDPQTISASTFTVKQGTMPVTGAVTYGPGFTATFTSANPLSSNVVYTASFTTGVKDLAGNVLAAYSWSFTTGTGAAKGPAAVLLGAAGNYVGLVKTAISSVATSAVTGDIAVSPAAESFITGFSLTDATGYATSSQITGKAYAADQTPPTPSNLTTAVSNMEAAYTDAASRPGPNFLELGTGNIGGKTLVPGLYKWTSTVTIPANVTISGGANDVWIFQTTGDLTEASAMQVTLAGGALAKNIFWQVAGKVTIGANAHFEGIILCKTDVTLQTSASMNGRILSQTAVALQKATLVQPAP